MHAGRVRLRPILMATFALIAGMLPVAIIGGTIASTLLTLLVVPTFYDAIEIARDRAIPRFQQRSERGSVAKAFLATLIEAVRRCCFCAGCIGLCCAGRGRLSPAGSPQHRMTRSCDVGSIGEMLALTSLSCRASMTAQCVQRVGRIERSLQG